MYLVYNENNEICNALDSDISKEQKYFCPFCRKRVLYKKGRKKQSHFAHIKSDNCSMLAYKRESNEHLQVKKELFEHFKQHYQNVNLEHIIITADSLQIADVYIADKNLALEYQRSPIAFNELEKRTIGYKESKNNIIWLIDLNKFVKETKVRNNIVYIKYAPFVDKVLNYHNGCIFFYGYDLLNKSFVFYQLWSCNLKKHQAVCKKKSIPLEDIKLPISFSFFKEDLITELKRSDVEHYIYKQLKYDKTVKNKLLSILYQSRIQLDDIPKCLGININEQLLIETPLLLWQAKMYYLVNEGYEFKDILKIMTNFLNFKDSIYLSNQIKNKIFLDVIKWYYKILLQSKEDSL